MAENEVTGVYELPSEVYKKEYLPYSPLMHGVIEVYADENTGIAPEITEVEAEKLPGFYEACTERLKSLMKMEEPGSADAQKKALASYEKVKTPYVYYSGIISDAMDYETLLFLLILICCCMIAASVFTSDYQTGADSILRCTRRGRTQLAITKIASICIISAGTFAICTVVWILMTNFLFGWESTKTSVQMLFSVTSLVAWNIGQLQWAVAGFGLQVQLV